MSPVVARSRRYFYVGAILIFAGVIFSSLFWKQVGVLGIVPIIIGVFFTLTGYNIKKSMSQY
jgi:uncharacterized membrane protein YdbT with pleckstrin-like domain